MLRTPRIRLSIFFLPVLLTALLVACGAPAPEPEPEPEPPRTPVRVENASLGLAYTDLMEGWEVAENEGETLKLKRTGDEGGELWIEVPPEGRAGVNLIKQVNDWKTKYEALPQGSFHGQVELKSQFGTTFSVRGRFEEDGRMWEERRILTLYPGANRTLSLVYRYPVPTADNPDAERLAVQERTNQMFNQMGMLVASTPEAG